MPHLQVVEAAAVIDLQKGPSTASGLTTSLDPATDPECPANLSPAVESQLLPETAELVQLQLLTRLLPPSGASRSVLMHVRPYEAE